MSNIVINTADSSLEILRDRASESSSIQRRHELMEGVIVELGDGNQNPSLFTLKFIATDIDRDSTWAAYDAIAAACKNAVSLTIAGVTKPITGIKRFRATAKTLSFAIEASYIVRNFYPLVGPNPNYLPSGALCNEDGSPMLDPSGNQILEG